MGGQDIYEAEWRGGEAYLKASDKISWKIMSRTMYVRFQLLCALGQIPNFDHFIILWLSLVIFSSTH